jgi:hypothetical protein
MVNSWSTGEKGSENDAECLMSPEQAGIVAPSILGAPESIVLIIQL